jgi:hypothetical protein
MRRRPRRRKASADDVAVVRDKLFEVVCPDGRKVRHRGASQEDVRRRLQIGYTIAGEIFGADDAGEGGVVAAIEPTGPSIMAGLLAAHGDELMAYLAARGIVGPVVTLPSNGRELQ